MTPAETGLTESIEISNYLHRLSYRNVAMNIISPFATRTFGGYIT